MVLGIQAFLLPLFYSQSPFFSDKSGERIEREDFDVWLNQQKDIAFNHILDNIGGISPILDTKDVPDGVVIASPSKVHPNYYYQWVRDSALTIRSLVYRLEDSDFTELNIASTIESYIANNYHLQRLDNWSGKLNVATGDYSGLGEPKFHPDLTAFNEVWGRPQTDGPGLRASTITTYLNSLEKHNRQPEHELLASREFIYHEIVKPDLHYILQYWNSSGFDLWEEVNSMHFFTSITQLRALKDGLVLYKKYDNKDPQLFEKLNATYENLKHYIVNESGYTQPGLPYIVETPSLLYAGKRSGLDAATFLGALHSHSLENEQLLDLYADIPFDVSESHILNSFRAMVADMKYRYPLNRYRPGWGVALGRYPEDIYDGYVTTEGNPWFISTASVAEMLFRQVFKLNYYKEDLVITKEARDFYKQFIDLVGGDDNDDSEIIFPYGSPEFNAVSVNLADYADSFLEIIKDHVDDSGRMSEQFNKYSGYMQGAEDLTWSYSSIWNCIRWRAKALELL